MDTTASLRRALLSCNAFQLQVVRALWLAASQPDATATGVGLVLGGPATTADVADALTHLSAIALVHTDGGDATPRYWLAPHVSEALGRFPAGLAAPAGLDPAWVREQLTELTDSERALITKLVPGPPIGSARATSSQRPVMDALIDRGLLIPLADDTVMLPQEVALAMRGDQPLGPALAHKPPLETLEQRPGSVDGAAAGQALAAHARAVQLLEILGEQGAPSLKSGGIGATAVRTLAKLLDCEPPTVALYLELLHVTGFIAPAPARGGRTARWLPTEQADTFLAGAEASGWALLVTAWLDLRRDPSKVGDYDDSGKLVNALTASLDWRRGPSERRRVVRELADAGPDEAPTPQSVLARLAFEHPLARQEESRQALQSVLADGTELGVIAFDALSSTGRVLLHGSVEDVAAALTESLPAPVSTVLVQADHTIVAPGRLTADLAAGLAEMAEVESAGSATVYRLSEASIRRSLDAGATATEMHQLLERHSSTPVPQSVSYLIDDVARRHGVLRVGAVNAVVHSADPALLAQAVAAAAAAALPMRLLAPTVAVSPAEASTLLQALQDAGLAPAAEDAAGDVIDLRPAPARTRAPLPNRIPFAEPLPPSDEQIAVVIRRLRASSESLGPVTAADTGDMLTLLRQAARARQAVWIGYADADGTTSTRAVEPIMVSAGTMVAFDQLRGAPRTFVLSRVISVRPET